MFSSMIANAFLLDVSLLKVLFRMRACGEVPLLYSPLRWLHHQLSSGLLIASLSIGQDTTNSLPIG